MVKYADRAFISVNGAPLADLESADMTRDKKRRAVDTMSPDGFNKGFVEGNWEFNISLTLAVRNQQARPKLENIDYENNDIQITWVVGADQYVATGVFLKTSNDQTPGVGQNAKNAIAFGALKVTDTIGNSVLFGLSLEPAA